MQEEMSIAFVFFVLEMGQIGNWACFLPVHCSHLKPTLKDENAQQLE
jgi:hypothetical protein